MELAWQALCPQGPLYDLYPMPMVSLHLHLASLLQLHSGMGFAFDSTSMAYTLGLRDNPFGRYADLSIRTSEDNIPEYLQTNDRVTGITSLCKPDYAYNVSCHNFSVRNFLRRAPGSTLDVGPLPKRGRCFSTASFERG
jgi:hypothetical protein